MQCRLPLNLLRMYTHMLTVGLNKATKKAIQRLNLLQLNRKCNKRFLFMNN